MQIGKKDQQDDWFSLSIVTFYFAFIHLCGEQEYEPKQ